MKQLKSNNINSKEIAMRVSIISIIVNIILSLGKLAAGIIANSGAMISDAIHSASDVFSTFIVIIGVSISNRKADDNHQYGHERLECVASIILAVILFITGIGIGFEGVKKILEGDNNSLQVPGLMALIAAVVSIIVKEWMYWFTKSAAKKINSGALMADAWHHRSDSLSSVGAFIGIFGARMGYPVLDSVASVGICIFIVKASYEIFIESINKMVDKSCDINTVQKMKDIIKSQSGVIEIDDIKTRMFGSKIYIDIEISADGSLTLEEGHKVAKGVHDAIEMKFSEVKHCMVHVNPAEENSLNCTL
jgi:cation diffusion facilitator family transporter